MSVLYTQSSAAGFRFYYGITGKVSGDWTKTLYRNQSTVAAETVTVTEDTLGWYYASFTPTVALTHYELSVSLSEYVVREHFQDKTLVSVATLATVCETEGSYTAQQILSILLAALAGRTSSDGLVFKTPNNAATRITGTVDATDNRTAITLNPSS